MSMIIKSCMILLLIVNILSTKQACAQLRADHKVAVLSSEIRILGQTNVNRFDCELFIPTITDTLEVESTWSNLSIAFDSLILKYQVNKFDCGHQPLTEDFREILKADEYPAVLLQVKEILISHESEGFEKLKVTSRVRVTLAGVEKDLLVTNSQILNHSESDLTLVGEEKVNMTGFGLEPPTLFWGALRVYDELGITFRIRLSVQTKKG